MKPLEFLGTSRADLKSFPDRARRQAGFQLERVQRGLDPLDLKPMKTIGQGVREIRVRDPSGAFRVVYTAVLGDAVYVLHAFEKKTVATAKHDIDLATARFRRLMENKR
jgi:phage-related protein